MPLEFTPPDDIGDYPDWVSSVEARYLDAVKEHGSQRKAAKALGVARNSIWEALDRYKKKAAKHGHAPGHFDDGVAPGYRMGKVTIQRANGVVERVWERQHPEAVSLDALIDQCEKRLADFPTLPPRPAPEPATGQAALLTNFLGLFDLHVGESISCDDPAGRWNIDIAKRTVKASVDHAMSVAPKAKRMVVCFGGDISHYDSLKAVTPKSRHVLHADGDAIDMADAVLDVAFYTIDRGLEHCDELHVIYGEGNHDEYTTIWMQRMIARVYRDNPRVHVTMSRVPFYALLFGKVMLCVHHGHGAKLEELSGKFAAMFRGMWGQAEYAYAHAGHQHHYKAKESNGLLATQHPSLAPSDDYALSKGLVSRRGCLMVTYHDTFGEVSRTTTRPEMLGVFDDA